MNRIILAALIIIINFSLSAQDSIQHILNEGERPSINNIYHEITDANGNQSSIPISIIQGKKTGQVFTIISGVHGFEYPPILATQQLIQEINPELLSGTLLIIPLTNPHSFYSRSPFVNPMDQINLNRAFPGKKEGSITEKIAYFIANTIIPRSDVFLDIHGGDANEDLLPFVCYYNNEQKTLQTQQAKRLAETSGFNYVVKYPYKLKADAPAKYAFKQAVQDGKTALSIECGKLGNVQEDAVALIKKGIYNMLHELKMYQHTTENKPEFKELNQQVYIKSKEKGIFYSTYKAGDMVKKGAIVGHTTDAFGQVLVEYQAPRSGVILYKIGTPPINENETVMCIGYGL